MFRARRWAGWTLILGAMAIVIVLGMLVRNEPRIQPIEPAKLAQLSEQERADWLIEQILARSQSQTPLWKLMNWLGYGWKRTGYELDITEITTLGEACLKYDKRGRWIRRLPAYAMNDSFRVVAEGHLAIWYLQRGDGRTAERVIQRIPPGEWCDIAQAYRAAWQARQGDHEGARKTLAQLPHDFVQSFHFHRKRAVAELAQSGMLDEAAQLVTQALLPVGEDPEVVQSILNAYKQAGRWDDAFVWARRLPSEWREYALGEWAAHALQQGDPDPTRRLNPSERTPAVQMRLARAAQTLNRLQQARSWREDTLRQLKRFPEPWREFQHMLVAIELAQVGDFEQAETVIRQMKRGQPPCFWAARQAANSALEQGDLNYAQRFAALIGAQNLRVRAYAAIAARLYQRGQQQQAQAIIERLKRELQPLKRLAPDASADLADGVCLPIIEAGSYELAQPLLRELEAEMQQIPFNSNRALLMYCIVKCYVRAGRLENAFRIAAEADTPEEQTRALLAILHAQIWGYQN